MTRTLVAYALIVLLIAAVAVGVSYVRYNSRDRRITRRREREKALRDEQFDDPLADP